MPARARSLHFRVATLALLAATLSCGAPRPVEGEPAAPPPPAPLPAASAKPSFEALSRGPLRNLLGVERADARGAPGEARPALAFALAVERLLDDPATKPGAADARALLDEALAYVDAALARQARGPLELQLSTRRASLRARTGHAAEALSTLEGLLAEHPNLATLDVLFRVAGDVGQALDVSAECKRVRPELRREVEVFALYDRCLAQAQATRPEAVLSWAAADELARYRKDRAERAAREERLHERFNEELIEEPRGDAGAGR